MFRGIQVTLGDSGAATTQLRTDLGDDELGEGSVTIDVHYSGINYKDGMALAGNPGVMRANPLIPGIDLVGTVTAVDAAVAAGPDAVAVGDLVLVNGCGLGETHNGGLAERARVSSEWLVPVPATISARQAAAIGTAGFTAALSVLALQRGGPYGPGNDTSSDPTSGDILVTGATGGVGSIAIALLAAAGHRVIASSGRPEHRDYLIGLGAAAAIDRAELESAGRPMQKQRWAGVIDSVGGQTLATAIAQTVFGGTVTACGMVGGLDIPTSVMPFILRGVSLIGINSVECPRPLRLAAWDHLAAHLDLDLLDSLTTTVVLDEAEQAGRDIISGSLRGRTVVDVRA